MSKAFRNGLEAALGIEPNSLKKLKKERDELQAKRDKINADIKLVDLEIRKLENVKK